MPSKAVATKPKPIMKIFKYQADNQGKIRLPKTAVFMHMELQNNLPTIWAAVDVLDNRKGDVFFIKATGETVDITSIGNEETGERFFVDGYIKTFVTTDSFVWHLFKEQLRYE